MSIYTRGHDLRAARQLTDTHFGRTVTTGELSGTLVGLIPVGDQVTLALIIGGARAWIPVAADTEVAVERKCS